MPVPVYQASSVRDLLMVTGRPSRCRDIRKETTVRRRPGGWIAVLAILATFESIPAEAERFVIMPGGEETLVAFESRAPLESFTGRTRSVRGLIDLTPSAIGDSVSVHVDVEMASLDTGIGKRNADMRENHLETDRYPTATFRGASLAGDAPRALADGQSTEVRMTGQLTLHGVTRRIELVVALTYERDVAGATLRARTRFPVLLADYEIPRPKFLFMKLGEEQQVTVDVLARATTAPATSTTVDGRE